MKPWEGMLDEGEAPASTVKPWEGMLPEKGEKPEEQRGLAAETGTQFAASFAIEVPRVIGQAMKWMSEKGKLLYAMGEKLERGADVAEEMDPVFRPQLEGAGIVRRALSTGARMLGPSELAMIPAAAAAPLGATAAAVGGAAGGFGIFGASQAQQTYDKLKTAGVGEDDAKRAAYINLLIEGGGETIANYAGLKLLGTVGRVFGKSPVEAAIRSQTSGAFWKPYAKQLAETTAVEAGTEFGQNYFESEVEQAYGGPKESSLEAGLQGAEGALGMTALLAPFGLAGFVKTARQNSRVARALENPNANPIDRTAASRLVFEALDSVNKEAAAAWSENASLAISEKAPIKLDESFAQKKDLVQEIIKAETVEQAVDAALAPVLHPEMHASDVAESVLPGGAATTEGLPSRVAREETAAEEQARRDSAFDQRDANIRDLESRINDLNEAEHRRLEQAYAERDAEIGRRLREQMRARESEGIINSQLSAARRIGESQSAYEARLEAQNASTVRSDQGVGTQAGQIDQGGRANRGGNLQQEQAQGVGADGTELREAGGDHQRAGSQGVERVAPAAQASAGAAQGAPARVAEQVPRDVSTAAPSKAGVSVEQSTRAQENVQRVRGSESAAAAAVLPRVSRGEHAAHPAEAQGVTGGPATESERTRLRERVRATGETEEEALRALRRSERANAPRRLQPATTGEVAVPRVSPSTARIFGRPVGELTDNALRVAATNHRMSAHREVAMAEIKRRNAVAAQLREEQEPLSDSSLHSVAEGVERASAATGVKLTPVKTEKEVPFAARVAARVVKAAFGKDVAFVYGGEKGYDEKGKAKWGIDGVVLPSDPNKVYVNLNSNRKWQAVIGHEVLHALKRTNEGVYNELVESVKKAAPQIGLERKYAGLSKEELNEERIGNIVGDQMSEPKFWFEVFKQTGDAKALANMAFSTIDKMMAKITKSERIDYNTKELLIDARRVRSAVAKAYARWQKEGATGKPGEGAALESKPEETESVGALESKPADQPRFFKAANAEDVKRLKIPPAWTDVYVAANPNASLVAIGTDSKGRVQYLYSAEHTAARLLEKFRRQRDFNSALPGIMEKVETDAKNGNEEAAVVRLLALSGFRVGSERVRGDKEAFGATTLKPEHVEVSGDTVAFDFPGKRGVRQFASITDPDLARDIQQRLDRGGERIFNTSDGRVRFYLHQIAEGKFKVHDFRTWNATDAARQAMAAMETPTSAEQYWQQRDSVLDAASDKINDTRAVTEESYVDPTIFDDWRTKAGVHEAAQRPRRTARQAVAGNAGALRNAPDRRGEEPAALQSKPAERGDQAAGESAASPVVTARQAVALDKANPLKKDRLGFCHKLAWRKVFDDKNLRQVIGVVNGWPSAPQPRAPIKIWHSFAYDPKSGNIWEPISDRWYSRAAMKAFGFEPVASITADRASALALKTGKYPDQQIYSDNVKKLRGAEIDHLQTGDYDANWKAIGEKALLSKPEDEDAAMDAAYAEEEQRVANYYRDVPGPEEYEPKPHERGEFGSKRRVAGGVTESPRLTWATRPHNGDWIAQEGSGRYQIVRVPGGFIATNNDEEVSFERSRQNAIAAINESYLEDIVARRIEDPNADKSILLRFTPEQTKRVIDGMKKLATAKGVFRLEVSDKKKLEDVLRDVDTEKVVKNVMPMGSNGDSFEYRISFNNGKAAFFTVEPKYKIAHVDAQMFEQGSQMGSFLYPALMNWAKNNGYKLVSDPKGLSTINTYRRTEQMLSAALKFGSTEFLSPWRGQLLYEWNEKPKTEEQQDKNLAIMALTAMDNTLSKVPEAEFLSYNFEDKRFEDDKGKPVDPEVLQKMAEQPAARRWGIGRTTLARAIFMHTLTKENFTPREEARVQRFLDGKIEPNALMSEEPVEKDKRMLALYSKPDYIGTSTVANSAARKAGLYRPERPWKERVKEMMPDFGKRFTQGLFDQFAPAKEIDYHSYMLMRMAKGSDGAVEAMFLYGRPFLRDGALDVTMDGGLTKVLQRLQGEHDRFFGWIAGNRAAQLKAEDRERLFEDDEIAWLKDLNQGKMGDGQSRAALYAEVHKEFNSYMKAVLDVAEQQGLIDPESRAVWEKEFYVPFYRNIEKDVSGPTVSSGMVSQQAFKRLKGGKEELNDLLDNTLRNWSHLLSAAMKNKAALSTLEAAVNMGAAVEAPSDYMGKQMQIGKVLKVLDGGRERYFIVEDPYLVDAISSLDAFSLGPIGKLFSTTKRWLTIGVTANPAFKIRNLLRDSIASPGMAELSYNPLVNVSKAWGDTAHDMQARASLLASGGMIRFGTQLEGSRAEYVRDLINKGVPADNILDKEHKVVAMLKLAWDRYQEFGDRGENVNRAAIYKKLREEGKTHLEAAFAARDLMDFSMQGSWRSIRILAQTVPFFNARLQGFYKLGRAAKENPRRMGTVIGAVALASMALAALYGDDDDWKKREDWDRDNFWWFKIPGWDESPAFRIPKPFEIGAVGSFAERLLELGISKEMTGKRFANVVWNDLLMNNLAMNPTPQLVKPLIEMYANKDFFSDRPIETQGMENLSPKERIGRGTSATAQLLGKQNIVSPAQIDHLIKAYFGFLGIAATTMLDFGLRPMMGLPERPEGTLRDAVLKNFVEFQPTNRSRYVTEFYDASKEITQAYSDWRHALMLHQPERAKEILEEGKEKIAMHGAVATTTRQLAAYSKLEKIIEADTKMSPEEKRKRLDRLDELKNAAAKRYSDLALKRRETQPVAAQ